MPNNRTNLTEVLRIRNIRCTLISYLHVVLERLPVPLVPPDQLRRLSLEDRELGAEPVHLAQQRRQVPLHLLPLRPHVPDALLVLDEHPVVVQAERVQRLSTREDQVKSSQVRSGQVRSGQVKSGQVRSGEEGRSQERARGRCGKEGAVRVTAKEIVVSDNSRHMDSTKGNHAHEFYWMSAV